MSLAIFKYLFLLYPTMTTIKNPELSLRNQQESLERSLNADLQMLIIDAIERGLSPYLPDLETFARDKGYEDNFSEIKTFAQDKGYDQIASLRAYLRKNKESLTQDTIQKLETALNLNSNPLWKQKTRDELKKILEEKKENYQQERSVFHILKVKISLDRIVQTSGIDDQKVKSWLQNEIDMRMPNYKILNQGLNYLKAIPLKPLNDAEKETLSQVSEFFAQLRRKPDHPLHAQLDEKKKALQENLAPFLAPDPASQTISQKQLQDTIHVAIQMKTLLQDWSYATRQKLSPSEEALSVRIENLAETLRLRYTARVDRFQDTKMAENYLRLQAMKKEQES